MLSSNSRHGVNIFSLVDDHLTLKWHLSRGLEHWKDFQACFFQKLGEINFSTCKAYCELISQNIFQVRVIFFTLWEGHTFSLRAMPINWVVLCLKFVEVIALQMFSTSYRLLVRSRVESCFEFLVKSSLYIFPSFYKIFSIFGISFVFTVSVFDRCQ